MVEGMVGSEWTKETVVEVGSSVIYVGISTGVSVKQNISAGAGGENGLPSTGEREGVYIGEGSGDGVVGEDVFKLRLIEDAEELGVNTADSGEG